MGQEEIKTERRAIKIVDGFITVEIVRRKKPSDKKGKGNILRILKRGKGKNGRMERRASADDKGQTG
jgi:hypothetical protein